MTAPQAAPAPAYAVTSSNSYTGPVKPLPPTHNQHIWIVTGPAGCGKTTVASFIAGRYSVPYLEGDTFHPPANIEKMAAGHPLTDSDRWDWLARVRDAAVVTLEGGAETTAADGAEVKATEAVDVRTATTGNGAAASVDPQAVRGVNGHGDQRPRAVVVTCSALKKSYRDILRDVRGAKRVKVHFVYLSLPEEVLFQRVRERVGHYMKESMVRSQIEDLEVPDEGERRRDTVVVEAKESKETVEGEVERGFEGAMGEDEI
ncbi:gluconokinase-like protein [Elsinoe australis]|uniref:gluconokinase n=1 Tax=Elsinoe australis TaxID=40998 RepID=A0A4V6DVA4_9PEZI|nr:gluconokinase-like protein [Elsinoe australis]